MLSKLVAFIGDPSTRILEALVAAYLVYEFFRFIENYGKIEVAYAVTEAGEEEWLYSLDGASWLPIHYQPRRREKKDLRNLWKALTKTSQDVLLDRSYLETARFIRYQF